MWWSEGGRTHSSAPYWSCTKPWTPVRLSHVLYITGSMVLGLHLMELKSCSGCLCDKLIAWVKDIGSSASIKQKLPMGLCVAGHSGVVIPPPCASFRSSPHHFHLFLLRFQPTRAAGGHNNSTSASPEVQPRCACYCHKCRLGRSCWSLGSVAAGRENTQ